MTEKFDWNTDETVIVPAQAAIAIMRDDRGNVLVRQEGQYCISEDQFIDIAPEHALTVCKAILREAGLHGFMIVPVSEIEVVGKEGNRMVIPADVLEKLDRITEEGRDEDASHRNGNRNALRQKRYREKKQRNVVTRDDNESATPDTIETVADDPPQPETPQQPFQLKLAHG